MLMGFLYTPGDYSSLLKNLGYVGDTIDADAIYWNIFPVYAQEMASIVTTYCSFNRRDDSTLDGNGGMGWKWNAGDADSPVMNYDQLDPNYYRDPNKFNRNPAKGGNSGSNWSDTVNDPTLPYNDAWQKRIVYKKGGVFTSPFFVEIANEVKQFHIYITFYP